MIKKIVIFGGGTSGWLTAAHFTNNLPEEIEICLIEDANKGPIGVGEGTQPLTAKFLYECGIEAKHWMKPSNAAFKYGVELTGWNNEPYFVDNDNPFNYIASPELFTSMYFSDKPYSEYAKWHPAYRLAKENKSPKLTPTLDSNFNAGPDQYGAVHFSAYDIIATIKDIILDKITYVDTEIKQVATGGKGISKLIDANGVEYTGDLFIDCSGFESKLLEKTMGSEFISYKPWLLNDSAVAMPTEYKDPVNECHPYTKATAMNAGWRWTIPTYHRIGNGYVYSSDYLTPEQAEQELRESLNEWDAPVKHLTMKCGTHKEVAVKNVIGVGLAAGFVEPLEATGITFTTAVVKSITDLILAYGDWTEEAKVMINRGYYEMNIEILAFVFAHYYFSNKNDTPYWEEVRSKRLEELPPDAQFFLSQYYPDIKPFTFFSNQSMFSSMQWWSMIKAGGYGNPYPLTTEEKTYLELFMNNQTNRIDQTIEQFPNHYEFLKGWYNPWNV